MLTPKHRALFAAAYSSQLLRRAEEPQVPAPPTESRTQPKCNENNEKGGALPAA